MPSPVEIREIGREGNTVRYAVWWHVKPAGGWFCTLTFPC